MRKVSTNTRPGRRVGYSTGFGLFRNPTQVTSTAAGVPNTGGDDTCSAAAMYCNKTLRSSTYIPRERERDASSNPTLYAMRPSSTEGPTKKGPQTNTLARRLGGPRLRQAGVRSSMSRGFIGHPVDGVDDNAKKNKQDTGTYNSSAQHAAPITPRN